MYLLQIQLVTSVTINPLGFRDFRTVRIFDVIGYVEHLWKYQYATAVTQSDV